MKSREGAKARRKTRRTLFFLRAAAPVAEAATGVHSDSLASGFSLPMASSVNHFRFLYSPLTEHCFGHKSFSPYADFPVFFASSLRALAPSRLFIPLP
jgi:hypothetical protein